MTEYHFEWDSKKAGSNYRKHKVSFSEAATAFYDERAYEFYDPDHSEQEDRFLLLGMSRSLRVLVVSYCYRENDINIRIISARKADKLESREYWKRGKDL